MIVSELLNWLLWDNFWQFKLKCTIFTTTKKIAKKTQIYNIIIISKYNKYNYARNYNYKIINGCKKYNNSIQSKLSKNWNNRTNKVNNLNKINWDS